VDRAKLDPIVRMEMDRIVPKIMQIFDRDDAFFKEIRKK
jgi:hypothetical protein